MWPLIVRQEPAIPVPPHPGAFGAVRRYDVHTGVDLYCEEGSRVVAMEAGIIVAIEDFTGPRAGSPWWNDTELILIEGSTGVMLYGEITVDDGLCVGDRVHEGDTLGSVKTVLMNDKGKPMTMLHFELYEQGTRESVWWTLDGPMPTGLRDPTELLRREANDVESKEKDDVADKR